MDEWLSEMCDLFFYFFGRETSTEMYVLVALCTLLGALALSRVGTSLGALGSFYITGVVVTVFGLVLFFAVMAVVPTFTYFPFWVSLILAALVLLVVVVPLTVLVQRGRYVTALIAWTVTLLTIGAILTLEPIAMRSFKRVFKLGVESAQKFEKHRIDTEKAK
ncbi:MAG: hypothetical protein WCH86_06995 [Kiritimatiellales bacterium]